MFKKNKPFVATCMSLPKWTAHKLGEYLVKKTSDRRPVEAGKITDLPPVVVHNIAVLIDNEVVEVIGVNDRLAAILLSEPVFISLDPTIYPVRPTIGWTYDNVSKTFTPAEGETLVKKD